MAILEEDFEKYVKDEGLDLKWDNMTLIIKILIFQI